jgi:3-hydroxyacyl-[acyl-carrier-protein] dehydratase
MVSSIAGNRSSKYRNLSAAAESRLTCRFAVFFVPFIAASCLFPERLPRRRYSIIVTPLQTTMNEINPAPDASLGAAKIAYDIHDILKILPHRYPLLLIDRVLELERRQRVVAIKNVTINEPFFVGHFPGLPIMPGVLIIEAIAQAGGALLLTEIEDRRNKVMVFTGIERAKFRKPVSPGDQLRMEVTVTGWRSVPGMTAAKMQGYAFVGDKKVAEAIVSCQLIDSSRGRGSNDGASGS